MALHDDTEVLVKLQAAQTVKYIYIVTLQERNLFPNCKKLFVISITHGARTGQIDVLIRYWKEIIYIIYKMLYFYSNYSFNHVWWNAIVSMTANVGWVHINTKQVYPVCSIYISPNAISSAMWRHRISLLRTRCCACCAGNAYEMHCNRVPSNIGSWTWSINR